MHWRRKWQPTPVVLPGESQGRGSLVGCRLGGCTESDTTKVTEHAHTLKDSKLTVPDHICFQIICCNHWRGQWHPTPVLLPGKSHGWRSLVGFSPLGLEESDTTERLHFHFSLSCIGEGNGNPLQCCCLESPRDGGAWWAAVDRKSVV